jgi:hypothetical protein
MVSSITTITNQFDFFFCGHPALYERECHLEHSAILEIYSVYSHGNDSIWIKPCVNGNFIPMELDTGSSVSVISEADYVKYFKGESFFFCPPERHTARICPLRWHWLHVLSLNLHLSAKWSLDKALEIAVAMETATKDAIELRNVQGNTPVHEVRGDRRRRNQGRSQITETLLPV